MKDVRVYALADYFIVEGLKDYALQRFRSKIRQLWVSEKFVDCIRDIYDSTIDPNCKMRQAVVEIVRNNIAELWEKAPFQEVLREGGDFIVDLMSKLVIL